MPKDWLSTFAALLAELESSSQRRAELISAFSRMSTLWSSRSVGDEGCFATGICCDGGPVEVSARINFDGRSELRFITQTHIPSKVDVWPEMARAALTFMPARVEPKVFTILQSQGLLVPGEAIGTGNFVIWVGFGGGLSGKTYSKLYLNPWCAPKQLRGFPVVFNALSLLGADIKLTYWLRAFLSVAPRLSLNLVGLNLATHPTGKVYFSSRLDRDELLNMLAELPFQTPSNFLMEQALKGKGRSGEVHLTLTFGADSNEPDLSVNLFCPQWIGSDEEVLCVLEHLIPKRTDFIERIRRASAAWAARDRVSFLGLSPNALTVYLRVGAWNLA